MSKFTHTDLDGVYSRLIGRSILQSIDPNDGQSGDPNDKSRHQYSLLNGVLAYRHLPPKSVGNRWRGNRYTPDWIGREWPRHWDLIMQWAEYVTGREPVSETGYVSTGGYVAYGSPASTWEAIHMVWRKSVIEIHGTDWPQQVPCPHCGGWIVWAEAGYVPGYRKCTDCLRHWQISHDSGRTVGWTMRPNGRKY